MRSLNAKEKLFCRYFAEIRNGREAAAAAGFAIPKKACEKLLSKEAVLKEIENVSKIRAVSFDEICAGYRRLAFGSCADALKLLLTEITDDEIERLDIFNVSEIKRPKDGALEIKFFDRLKALQCLEEISRISLSSDEPLSFYQALEKSAEAASFENEV
ncbi:MAG: terminase small subunit [Clostridiales bacterium]|nr:terminase small subunit [Clostridiales bacterium]